YLGACMDSAADTGARARRGHRHSGGTVPRDATGNGRGHCRLENTAPNFCSTAEPDYPWDFWSWTLCRGRRGKSGFFTMKCGPTNSHFLFHHDSSTELRWTTP